MRYTALLLLALLAPLSAPAQDVGDPAVSTPVVSTPVTRPRSEDLRTLLSARGYGMGNAWRALGGSAECGTGNPASLALFQTYRIELTGGWDWKGKDAFGMAAIADSVSSPLATGVTYQLVSLGPDSARATANLTTLSFALPLADILMIGVSTRYLVLGSARSANVVTGDVGLIFRPTQLFTLGFSAHNLIDTGTAELTRYYSLHAGVFAGVLTLAADARADFTTHDTKTFTYSGGLEFLAGKQLPLRAGYTWDGFTRASQLGVGLGLTTQGGGLDLSYRHGFGGVPSDLIALTLKVQVH